MYFWKIEKLKESIRENKLTEKQRFIYLILYVVLGAICLEVMAYIPTENPNKWDIVNNILNVLIPSIGTYFSYKSNGADSGNDFIGKYFSICFVLSIRFLVYLVPILILYFLYYFYAYQTEEEIQTNFIDVIPFSIWHAAIYWRLCFHIRHTV